jgi:hypothetical protein
MPIYTIYEIKPLDKELEYSYIGSTKNFIHRKSTHKGVCNSLISNKKDRTLYKFIIDNGGWDAFVMVPMEEFECETKTQARIQEQAWIDKNENKKLNMNKAYITTDENKKHRKIYKINNKEKITEQKKQYYVENTEKIVENAKIYYNANKEEIILKKKQYRVENVEALRIKSIKYYNDNKKIILAKQKIRNEAKKSLKNIECEKYQSSLSNPEIS